MFRLTTVTFLVCVGFSASAAAAQPVVLPHPTFHAGKPAALEVVAPGDARSCTITVRGSRGVALRGHVPLGGPTRRVRWRVNASARGTWRAAFSCYGRGGAALGTTHATVAVRSSGPAHGRLVKPGSVRFGHGSIPEMPAASATVALSNPLSNADVTINACSGGAVVGCFNRCSNSEEIASTRTIGNGIGTAVQVEPTSAAIEHARVNFLKSLVSDEVEREDFQLYRTMWNDLNRCANLPGDLTADQRHSLYEQMACHALLGVASRFAGNTWDFEAWHQNVDWSDALTVAGRCGQSYGDVPVAAAGLLGKPVRSFDTHASTLAPQTWLVDNLNGVNLKREVATARGVACLTAGKGDPRWYPSSFLNEYLAANGPAVSEAEACGTAPDGSPTTPAAPGGSPSSTGSTPPSPTPNPTPTPTVDRTAAVSYDRIAPGAPHHGYFDYAYQAFTAESNTITQLGVTVGSQSPVAGAQVEIRLCATQPDAHGNCQVLGRTTPQIVNYGGTYGDIGDVAVDPGRTYWINYFQPSAGSGSWVTYWWAGGGTISTSDQMQAAAKGYNR
jgi:hypothetical protein